MERIIHLTSGVAEQTGSNRPGLKKPEVTEQTGSRQTGLNQVAVEPNVKFDFFTPSIFLYILWSMM